MKPSTLRKHVRVVGRTITGKPVLGGAFFCSDSMGLPLADQILAAERDGCAVSLYQFYHDALMAGWTDSRARREIRDELRFLGRWVDAELMMTIPMMPLKADAPIIPGLIVHQTGI